MSGKRRIDAVYSTVEVDAFGALDCILHTINIVMEEKFISKEKGANHNDKTNEH